MSDRKKLLYLLAPSYSGSTLLTYLLSQHARIATIGELKATRMGDVASYRCSCGTLIRECDFWRQLRELAASRGVDFSVDDFETVFSSRNPVVNKVVKATVRGRWFEAVRAGALSVVPERVARLDYVAHRNFVLSQAVCEIQGGDIFVDGSKDPARLMHMIRSGLWDVYVIYLQREGRAVSNSYRKHDGFSFSHAINYWRHAVHELRRMRTRLADDRVFDLRYEDLCREPELTMTGIWSWLGVDDQPLQDLGSIAAKSHILGNRMRLRNASEIRYDDTWKSALSPADLALFERRAGDLNRTLGYEEQPA